MAKTVNVTIRMDPDLKKQAEQLFADLGMNMTTAINVFVRQSVNHGGIPFEIAREEDVHSDDSNQQILKESISQIEQNRKSGIREKMFWSGRPL